jgi:hypothetical protein
MRAREARDPDPAMMQIDVLASQIAELRHAEPMIERAHKNGGIAPEVCAVCNSHLGKFPHLWYKQTTVTHWRCVITHREEISHGF